MRVKEASHAIEKDQEKGLNIKLCELRN